MIELRAIQDVAGCRAVVGLQEEVWGRDGELVPASVLIVSARRGGILIGAFDGESVVGFVWSIAGWRDGAPTQWSHMLAVRPAARRHGLGERLKIAQRQAALATPIDLIEWTFDPLQAANAHLNLQVLGGVAREYRPDAYGAMRGPLHRGTPTDRLVIEWWIRRPHVERRIEARRNRAAAVFVARDHSVLSAPAAIAVSDSAGWRDCGAISWHDARRVLVPVPPGFTRMQQEAPDLAVAWRTTTRTVFTHYLGRGYRVVDFLLDPEGGGNYVVAREA